MATTAVGDLAKSDAVLAAVPAQHLRQVLGQFHVLSAPIILCAKGIEAESGELMPEVLADCLPHCPGLMLSGPSFAADVALGSPDRGDLGGPTSQTRQGLGAVP